MRQSGGTRLVKAAAVGLAALAAGPVLPGGAVPPAGAARTPVFELKENSLPEAAGKVGRVLGLSVEVRVEPMDPAHGRRPSLRMAVLDPKDLLNAASAAYGLRWVWLSAEEPRRIAFVGKQEYVGTASGLRQALADALPLELHGGLLGDLSARNQRTEGRLKVFQGDQLAALERLTAAGPVPLGQLPRELAPALLDYIAAYDVFALARACDMFVAEAANAPAVRCRYGKDGSGARRFFFPRPRGSGVLEGVTEYGLSSPTRWSYRPEGSARPDPAGEAGAARTFAADRIPLPEAAEKVTALLGYPVTLRLDRNHPARRLRPTLRMTVSDPTDLLNALAAAYGLRWVWLSAEEPRRIAFVGKHEYVGTASGLRQALADALPLELHGAITGAAEARAPCVDRLLDALTPAQRDVLEQLTAEGTMPVGKLPPDLTPPLLLHLAGRGLLALSRACDQYPQRAFTHRSVLFRYWQNPGGTRQFDIHRGNQFIGVVPE